MDSMEETRTSQEQFMSNSNKSSCKINKTLLPVKIQYFIFLAAMGSALPYRTVFAKQLGFSGAAIGAIFTVVPFAKIITNPLFGAILDYSKKFRLLSIVILILVALSHVLMVFVPPLITNSKTYSLLANIRIICSHGLTKIDLLESYMNTNVPPATDIFCHFQCSICNDSYTQQCRKECTHFQPFTMFQTLTVRKSENISETIIIEEHKVNFSSFNKLTEIKIHHKSHLPCFCNLVLNCTAESCWKPTEKILNFSKSENEFVSPQFWLLFVLITISSTTFTAILFLTDTACYEIMDSPENYGRQRLWGGVGFGIGSLFGGYVNDLATGDSTMPDYEYCFYALAIMCIISIVPVSYIKVENVKYSQSVCKDVGRLLCRTSFLTYNFMLLFAGVLSGLSWNYFSWFLEDIGGSPLLLGIVNAAESFLSEVPCFIIAGWVIRKIGHRRCMSIAFFCFGVRFISFAYLKNPWLSLVPSVFYGPTFGILFASVTTYGKETAPPGTEASMQALLSLTFDGLGVTIGTLLGGIGFESIGGRATIWYAGILSFAFLILSILWDIAMSQAEQQDLTVTDISVNGNQTEVEKVNVT